MSKIKIPEFKSVKYKPEESKKFSACEFVEPITTGLTDKNGTEILNGSMIQLYLKGEWHICKIIWYRPLAMFCLLWTDGYINKFQLHVDNYRVIDGLTELEISAQRNK